MEEGTSIPASSPRWEGLEERSSGDWMAGRFFSSAATSCISSFSSPSLLRSLGVMTFFGLLVEWFGKVA